MKKNSATIKLVEIPIKKDLIPGPLKEFSFLSPCQYFKTMGKKMQPIEL
jgi:hypothetical protein